eukprot:Plantae.Rhodophyta-Purpureofilum_apyrenoidigerum.ctg4502.p1 GENE.Plantae.Rhodophyta-Purpureofilum_apyrenoidigerum.ctg4502~~Plantae.Rhodophyta-Purpureofilum_apyrenoidigerum.ctg4502.p1  ORF type:complete len:344 (-),score=63.28 Plantae.Rhodophyta-Purpureofilum_apyrenoidigerum.ctg4502:581-1612(-)
MSAEMDKLKEWCLQWFTSHGWHDFNDVVEYLMQLSSSEVSTYINSLFGTGAATDDFVAEYLARLEEAKAPRGNSDSEVTKGVDGMFVSEVRRKKKRERRRTNPTEAAQGESAQVEATAPDHVRAVDGSDMIMSRIREARRHKEIMNCLLCGKIHMEVPRDGSCSFCRSSLFEDSQAGEDALALKNRLLEYDRTAAKRTTVLDDDADYFESGSATWLSEEEKVATKKAQEERARKKEEAKRRLVMTIDVSGRRVYLEDAADGIDDEDDNAGPSIGKNAVELTTNGSKTHQAPLSDLKRSTGRLANLSLGAVRPQFIRTDVGGPLETGVHLARPTCRVQREQALD